MRDGEFKVEVQPDGSLLITATLAGRDWLAARQKEPGMYGSDASWILQDALRSGGAHGLADGGYGVFAPSEAGPSPYGEIPYDGQPQRGVLIAAGMRFNDEGRGPAEFGLIDDMVADRLWWFAQADQISPIDELRTKGVVVFAAVPSPQAEPQRKPSASFGL